MYIRKPLFIVVFIVDKIRDQHIIISGPRSIPSAVPSIFPSATPSFLECKDGRNVCATPGL